jgi:hypothetical protein
VSRREVRGFSLDSAGGLADDLDITDYRVLVALALFKGG